MQEIMVKMLFTELMRTVFDDYQIEKGALYSVVDEIDQSVAAIHVLANINYNESLGIED